ncbi:MAG: C4-dicarboxylate transporter DcuC [Cytophagales bacterium]|nr:C4-dicarboxylate transporter DcuC [Cytophaga sp.]
MLVISVIIALHVIAFVAWLLYKRYNPQVVLLISGILLFLVSYPLEQTRFFESESSGILVLDVFIFLKDAFVRNIAGIGFMIMVIGGFASYMHKIGASNALVYVSLQPLSIFKKYPYFAAVMVIPIGQLLFICIPSATGLALLFVASILPILIGLGISRLSAVSVITACTAFDLGPGSFNTGKAAELMGKNNIAYFIDNQLPVVIPMTILMMILFFFYNRYYDKQAGHIPIPVHEDELKVEVPLIYAILPVLPIILLFICSSVFNLFAYPIKMDIATAIFITLFIALAFECIRTKKVKETFSTLIVFWEGMGKLFVSVVSLLVASEIFANGLISIGFITGLTETAQQVGLGSTGLGLVLVGMMFAVSILTGSGSATFQAFASIIYNGTGLFGVNNLTAIVPMQLASSMGRAMSPISGVVIASAQSADVSAVDLAKRNSIPMIGLLLCMMLYYAFL